MPDHQSRFVPANFVAAVERDATGYVARLSPMLTQDQAEDARHVLADGFVLVGDELRPRIGVAQEAGTSNASAVRIVHEFDEKWRAHFDELDAKR